MTVQKDRIPLDCRLIHRLHLKNVLSFGPDTEPIELHNLNVLIGPNGSGKSNLIEAIALLRASARDLRSTVRNGGGAREWIWKGRPSGIATVEAHIDQPDGKQVLRHVLEFSAAGHLFHLEDERIDNPEPNGVRAETSFYYRYQRGNPVINVSGAERQLDLETLEPDQSILAQRKDPESYPEVTFLADRYERIRIYREWSFGRETIFRVPQKADMRNDRLEEDFSNLGLFLNRMRRAPKAKERILSALRKLYEGLTDFDVSIEGGTVQVFFTEGDFVIPATRLSDGSLRYLCLLAIMCDPEPPPLICLEEPELGLHPDILPQIADLLLDAAERTQLIVTTHSDILVDAMTERPEVVLVCEKHNAQTNIRRLDQGQLSVWLDQYRLGELWTSGQLGGTRW